MHNASGLSYFMEFMDRKNRMRLVQFWIVVDGFRNPLEEDNDEPGQAFYDQPSWTAADRMDIAQINEAYLSLPELNVPAADRKAVQDYLKVGSSADTPMYLAARRAVLKAQTSVFEEMKEKHFENFRKSDLFYKWLATEESSVLSASSEKSVHFAGNISDAEDKPRGKTVRTLSGNSNLRKKEPELRRAVMSSTDLSTVYRPTLTPTLSRSSMDDTSVRPSLFDDDIDDERLTRSVPSLANLDAESDSYQNGNGEDSSQVVDAVQTALNEIMDAEPETNPLLSDPSIRSSHQADSPRSSTELSRPPMVSQKSKPSIASLGLVGASKNIGVFSDDLFGDEDKFSEDEREDSDALQHSAVEDIHEAAPGDLGLAEAIDSLNAEIERLTAQESILDSLTRKAELTNNAAELRILRKSKQSLQREVRRKEMQKQQYVVQESDNSLYGRAAVSIKSVMVAKEEDGHEYALCKLSSRKVVAVTNIQKMLSKYADRLAIRCRLPCGQ